MHHVWRIYGQTYTDTLEVDVPTKKGYWVLLLKRKP
jgi:hypothetical protein